MILKGSILKEVFSQNLWMSALEEECRQCSTCRQTGFFPTSRQPIKHSSWCSEIKLKAACGVLALRLHNTSHKPRSPPFHSLFNPCVQKHAPHTHTRQTFTRNLKNEWYTSYKNRTFASKDHKERKKCKRTRNFQYPRVEVFDDTSLYSSD